MVKKPKRRPSATARFTKQIKLIFLNSFLPSFNKHKAWVSRCCGFAIVLILLNFFWLSFPRAPFFEYEEMGKLHYLNPAEWVGEHHKENAFYFINTSKNQQVIYDNDSRTLTTTIADRNKLIATLKALDARSEKIKFIICDLFFDSYTDHITDSTLQAVLTSLTAKRKIVVASRSYNKELLSNFRTSLAVSGYKPYYEGSFYKFDLIDENGFQQVPTAAFSQMNNIELNKTFFPFINICKPGNKILLNRIIPDFRIRNEQLKENENYVNLGKFTDSPESADEKIVIIGDLFSGDNHLTYSGTNSGPLIIANILKGLQNNDYSISFSYFVLLFVFYFLIAYNTLYKKHRENHSYPEKRSGGKIFKLIKWSFKSLLSNLDHHINYVLLILLTYISMEWFGKYIYFLVTAFVLLAVEIFFRIKRKAAEQMIDSAALKNE